MPEVPPPGVYRNLHKREWGGGLADSETKVGVSMGFKSLGPPKNPPKQGILGSKYKHVPPELYGGPGGVQ